MKVVYISNKRKSHSSGLFVMSGKSSTIPFPCALGRSGITSRKREGDGATPAGRYKVIEAFYRADSIQRPRTQIPLRPIRADDGWCDGATDRNYNKLIRLPYSASHEKMMRDDHLYNLVVVLDYNIKQRSRGMGSAIFFHLAHPDFSPTEGCVAVHEPVMRAFLEWADTETVFEIRQ